MANLFGVFWGACGQDIWAQGQIFLRLVFALVVAVLVVSGGGQFEGKCSEKGLMITNLLYR